MKYTKRRPNDANVHGPLAGAAQVRRALRRRAAARGDRSGGAGLGLPQHAEVRKTPCWPRNWAIVRLLWLYSHRNAWANLYILTAFSLKTGPLQPPARSLAACRHLPHLRRLERRLPGRVHGLRRARSHCRFAPPLIHFIPYSLTYSVPLFLKRQCDRTLGLQQGRTQDRGGHRGGPHGHLSHGR
jgi:hypothetical protein